MSKLDPSKNKKKCSDLINNLNNSNNEITKLSENDIKDLC